MPVILVHRPFWDGLLEWFESTLVAQGMVGADELALYSLADSADEVLDTIFAFYQRSGFEASAEEQEIKLNL